MKRIRTSSELVDILDNYLKEKKISRRQFCALVDIPNSTISSWKSKNVLPSIELVAKVAKFMNVSLDSLVYDSTESFNEISFAARYSQINSTITSIYSDLDKIKEKLSKVKDI